MTFDHVKSQIKQYIDESHTNGELFGKVMDLYMDDDSIPIEIREKAKKLIERYLSIENLKELDVLSQKKKE